MGSPGVTESPSQAQLEFSKKTTWIISMKPSVAILLIGFSATTVMAEVPFSFPSGWAGKPNRNKALKHFDAAEQCWYQRKFVESVRELGEAIDADPFNERYLDRLCSVALAMKDGKYEKRLAGLRMDLAKRLRAMTRRFPDHADFEYQHLRLMDHPKWMRRKKTLEFLEKYPSHHRARQRYARLYLSKAYGDCNIDRGRKILLEQLKKDPSWADGWIWLGQSYGGYIPKQHKDGKLSRPCHMMGFLLGAPLDYCVKNHMNENGDPSGMMIIDSVVWHSEAFLRKPCPYSCGYWYASRIKSVFDKGKLYEECPKVAEGYYREWLAFRRLVRTHKLCTGGLARRWNVPINQLRDAWYAKHPEKRKLKELPDDVFAN